MLKRENIVIYGACAAGEAALAACTSKGLHVLCFCDDSEEKNSGTFCGYPVRAYKEICSHHGMDFFLIIAVSGLDSILFELKNANRQNRFATIECVLNDFDINSHVFASCSTYRGRFETKTCLDYHRAVSQQAFFIKSLDIVITERCSLRCAHCSNLMQYYQHPKDFHVDSITRDVEKVLGVVDGICEVRILGGEPFLHKGLSRIVDTIAARNHGGNIAIYTNGTILPNDDLIRSAQRTNTACIVSDYGALSRNLDKVIAVLQKNNVAHWVHRPEEWMSCSTLHKWNRSREQSMATLENCCVKHLTTMIDGKIYRCPFIGNAMNLEAIPHTREDGIALDALSSLPKGEAREILQAFLLQKEVSSCDYCAGRPFQGGKAVPPAVQIAAPIPYEKCGSRIA